MLCSAQSNKRQCQLGADLACPFKRPSQFCPESQTMDGATKIGYSMAVALSLKESAMPANILTTEDLIEFKLDILQEIRKLLTEHGGSGLKRYLKSSEVMELLKISPGTLQNLRINGTLPYSKIGGVIFYDMEDIKRVMEENRVDSNNTSL